MAVLLVFTHRLSVRAASVARLLESLGEICCAEVGVALKRLDRFVATDSPYFYRIQPFLKKPCNRFMPKVVEP